MKIFTLLPIEVIAEVMREHAKAPQKRFAQRTLAEEVVSMLYRSETAQKCVFQTAALYPAPSSDGIKDNIFNPEMILDAFRGDGKMLKRLPFQSIAGLSLARLLKMIGIARSHSIIHFRTNINSSSRSSKDDSKWRSVHQWRSTHRDRSSFG